MIDEREITVSDVPFRVVVTHEDEHMTDPRDWWPSASDRDVHMWRTDQWQYVTVMVTRLHECADCRTSHDTPHTESLGMVALGSGDGWKVALDDLVAEHPVPDMIAELMKGKP